jgi:hypothetical protein
MIPSLERPVPAKESRLSTGADDVIEIVFPIGSQAITGHPLDVVGIGSADEKRHLFLFDFRQPFLESITARPQVQFRIEFDFRVIASSVQFQIIPFLKIETTN